MIEEELFRKKERDGMHFHSRSRSKKGVAGFVLSIIGIAVFLALCIISAVTKGTAGQAIGVVGNTALLESGIGEHLHFSVSCAGVTVDPEAFLAGA